MPRKGAQTLKDKVARVKRELSETIERVHHHDSDLRQVAISDLTILLENDRVDTRALRTIIDELLRRLKEDKNSTVKSLAVNCLAIACTNADTSQLQFACKSLCTQLVSGEADIRDVFATGLQKVVESAPRDCSEVTDSVLKLLLPAARADPTAALYALRGIVAVVRRLVDTLTAQHYSRILGTLLVQLAPSVAEDVRLAAIDALSILAVPLPESLLHSMMTGLVRDVAGARSSGTDVMPYVQAIGAISRAVGFRLGRHVPQVVTLLLDVIGTPKDDDNTPASNDLRQRSLNALEAFITRCVAEVTPFVTRVMHTCLALLAYDPNFEYAAEDGDVKMDADSSDEDSDEGYGDYDSSSDMDDDDSSWKTRRAAAQALGALIRTRTEMLHELYEHCADALIRQFREREQSVQLDVLSCFSDLLQATFADDVVPEADGDDTDMTLPPVPTPLRFRQLSGARHVEERMSDVVRAVTAQLRRPALAIVARVKFWTIMTQLAAVVRAGRREDMARCMNENALVATALADVSGELDDTLALEALNFVHTLLHQYRTTCFEATHVKAVVTIIGTLVAHKWPKLVAQALNVAGGLGIVINNPRFPRGEAAGFASQLLEAVMVTLTQQDIDRKIKTASISAAASLFALAGALLNDVALSKVVAVLLERLGNEFTRLATLRAIETLASAPHTLNLRVLAQGLVATFGSLLKLQVATHRVAAVRAVSALLTHHPEFVGVDLFEEVLSAMSQLVVGEETALCALTLTTCASLARNVDATLPLIQAHILPAAFSVANNHLLQGEALASLQAFFQQLATFNARGMRVHELLKGLNRAGTTRRSRSNVARCIAGVCESMDDGKRRAVVNQMLKEVNARDKLVVCQSLMNLGEVGALQDLLPHHPGILEALAPLALDLTGEVGGDAREAAAVALGGVIAGAPAAGMGWLLPRATLKDACLVPVLCVVKEMLDFTGRRPEGIGAELWGEGRWASQLLGVLVSCCSVDDTATSGLVSECMGAIAVFNPPTVVDQLRRIAQSDAVSQARVAAVRAINAWVRSWSVFATMMLLCEQQRLTAYTRSSTLIIELVRHLLVAAPGEGKSAEGEVAATGLLPILYENATPVKAHKRKVDLGRSKVIIDDGLELRKATHRCMAAIIEHASERVDATEFLPVLRIGLLDSPEVQWLCNTLLIKLCKWRSWQRKVLSDLEAIATVQATAIGKAAKSRDTLRSIVRAMVALASVPDAESVVTFMRLYDQVATGETTSALFKEVGGGDSGDLGVASGAGAGAGAGAGQ